MPPATQSAFLDVLTLSSPFFVHQLKAGESIPAWVTTALSDPTNHKFLSITRTQDEVSIVGEQADYVPAEYSYEWNAIWIRGPMDFGLTGIMADLASPLKAAKVPIFAISTWNTDYVLLPREKFELGLQTLREDGWKVVKS